MEMSGMSNYQSRPNVNHDSTNVVNKPTQVQQLDPNQVVNNQQAVNPPGVGTQIDIKL